MKEINKRTIQAVLVALVACVAVFPMQAVAGLDVIPSDRRIDWNPGIPGGIPERTIVCADVTEAPYSAIADDSTNVTAVIQKAIDECPEGQVVYIPEGTYRLDSGLTINKGIVLRGAGPGKTKLKFYRGTGSDRWRANIEVSSGKSSEPYTVLSGHTKGSTAMTLEGTGTLAEGDLFYINQLNDGDLVTNRGSLGTCNWCGEYGANRSLGQTLLITGVQGNTITFEPELYWNYSKDLDPRIRKKNAPVRNAGIENLYIEHVNDTSTQTILMKGCVYSWVRNIESNLAWRHIQLEYSYGCEVRESYIHHHHDYVPNHYGVLVANYSSANLIENNSFYHTKGGTMMLAWGASGNVMGYNYCNTTLSQDSYSLQTNLSHHGAHNMMNLWEGNIVQKMSADSHWGSSSHNTFYRNHVVREFGIEGPSYSRFCVVLADKNRFYNVVGNVLGYEGMPGKYEVENEPWSYSGTSAVYKFGYTSDGDLSPEGNDPEVLNTIHRHGNFDYFTEKTIWAPDTADHDLPSSLYLDKKPDFFGGLPFPVIGPDVEGFVKRIPAQIRFEGGVVPDPVPENLVLSYSFEQSLEDAAGNINNGELLGDASYSTVDPVEGGFCLVFDGSNDAVSIPDNDLLDITDSLTLAAWVKTDDPNGENFIAYKSGSFSFDLTRSWDSSPHFYLYTSSGRHFLAAGTTIVPDTWYHVAATYDNDTQAMKLFINGVEDSSAVVREASTINVTESRLYLGKPSWSRYFLGSMDGFQIFNKALSADEVGALYSGETAINMKTFDQQAASILKTDKYDVGDTENFEALPARSKRNFAKNRRSTPSISDIDNGSDVPVVAETYVVDSISAAEPGMPVRFYEDGEDGLVTGWNVYDDDPPGASIDNIYDIEAKSQVIRFFGSGDANGYCLRNSDGTWWNNSEHSIMSWRVNAVESFVVYVVVGTKEGLRYLKYVPVDENLLGDEAVVEYGLGEQVQNGTWQTIIRDLGHDLKTAQPENELVSILGFLVRGNCRVDDIQSMASMPVDKDRQVGKNLQLLDD